MNIQSEQHSKGENLEIASNTYGGLVHGKSNISNRWRKGNYLMSGVGQMGGHLEKNLIWSPTRWIKYSHLKNETINL